jgi:hypothetical protein
MMSILFTPTITSLSKHLSDDEKIVIIIAPFISKSGLESFISELPISIQNFKVITRWRAEDLSSGVSDPEIFPELQKLGADLYINDLIHLKVFITSLNRAYVGSSNITLTGLGLAHTSNIEAGSINRLTRDDWEALFDIINTSRLVDEATYEVAQEYCDMNKKKSTPPPLELPPNTNKKFLVSQLPSVDSPELLFKNYSSIKLDVLEKEDELRTIHDLNLFNIPAGLNQDDFYRLLINGFIANPFIKAIVDHIQELESISFGSLTAWLHNNCQDVPVPYRSEIKELVVILYNWMPLMCKEISVSIPGRHSQVLTWNS